MKPTPEAFQQLKASIMEAAEPHMADLRRLLPCPFCKGEKRPTIYQGRNTRKWMLRSGYGCWHGELECFGGFKDSAAEHEAEWNEWVVANQEGRI